VKVITSASLQGIIKLGKSDVVALPVEQLKRNIGLLMAKSISLLEDKKKMRQLTQFGKKSANDYSVEVDQDPWKRT